MTPLKYLTYEGLSIRTYNALMRYGYHYIEDLLGTDPYYNTIAEGPEPLPTRTVGPKHSKVQSARVEFPPGRESWYHYRYRDAWLDIRSVGAVGIEQIKDSLAEWKRSCEQRKGSSIIDDREED